MAEKGDNVNLLMVIAFNNVCDNQDLTPLVSQTTNTRKVFLRGEQRKAETQKNKKKMQLCLFNTISKYLCYKA